MTRIQVFANRWLVTILCTVLCTYPVTALEIAGANVLSTVPTRGRPLLVSRAAAWLVTPVTLRRVVIAVVILSVSAFCTAGSWISGSMFAM